LQYADGLPIGEILLNSMERDGTGFGYDIETVNLLSKKNTRARPVILSGGAGNYKHFHEVFLKTNIQALATANLFNFIGNGLEFARSFLLNEGINRADWRRIDD
jgi:cyclase